MDIYPKSLLYNSPMRKLDGSVNTYGGDLDERLSKHLVEERFAIHQVHRSIDPDSSRNNRLGGGGSKMERYGHGRFNTLEENLNATSLWTDSISLSRKDQLSKGPKDLRDYHATDFLSA